MPRRSTPQARTDDRLFPVRVKFHVPGDGLGLLSDRVHAWLREELPRREWAWHSVGGAAALYFRRIEDAQRLIAAFPEFELADGVGAS